MSERLRWKQPPGPGPHYSWHSGEYSVCKVGSAYGWTYELWIGSVQKVVGLASGKEACALAQRYHDRKQENHSAANSEPA